MLLFKVRYLILLVLMPIGLFADAIMVSRAMKASTITEIFIEQEAVRVELEIGMGDIPAFRNILPDAIYEKLSNDPSPIAQRLELFFSEDFVIEVAGTPLDGGVLQMEPRKRLKRDDITGEPLPNQGEGQDILFAELVYPMEGNPSSLSIKPPTDQDSGFVSASIGLMTYHMGLPVMDFRYLGRNETISAQLEDPWYSRFKNKNLWRQYNEITPDNIDSFHFHGDTSGFPVTAIIAVPNDEKAGTLLQGKYLGDDERVQIVKPSTVMDELLSTILTVQNYVIAAVVVIGFSTLLTAVLVFMLSLRLRKREIETMHRIGGSKARVFGLLSTEVAVVLLTGLAFAGLLTLLASRFGAQLIRLFLL